ncbi:MAG: hypothetical protein KA807_06835 [Prolixibacteraceae bacterium]|nr:hypothetical protein [Prolixibacteraceae bacterium]
MKKTEFIEFVRKPWLLDDSSEAGLREIIEYYPFFPAARSLYLRNLKNTGSFKFNTELSKNAIFISDRSRLFSLLELNFKDQERYELIPIDDTINLGKFNNEYKFEEIKIVSSFSETPIQLIETEEEQADKKELSNDDLIERFLKANPIIPVVAEEETHNEQNEAGPRIEEDLITETLASIYMKQGLYKEAIKAYEKLSLKIPEKNIYFAGQIEKIKELLSKDK